MPSIIHKDPSAVLDYRFNWNPTTSPWLASGEQIASYTITASSGITVDSDSNDGSSVTVWLSGGTAGKTYRVTCEITTDSTPARKDQRTMQVKVLDR